MNKIYFEKIYSYFDRQIIIRKNKFLVKHVCLNAYILSNGNDEFSKFSHDVYAFDWFITDGIKNKIYEYID